MGVRVSKFLSLVLRHDPARVGITLDEAGWTDVAALLVACATHGVTLSRDELGEIVASSDKQRFALSPDGTRIRANQGHSVEVDLQLATAEPPAMLYHGTVETALPGIRERGLERGARHHVHLSADLTTATKVGSRRGKPVILTIRADAMVGEGHVFYLSENGVWLADHVPPRFIMFKGPKGSGTVTRGAKVGIAKLTLAACDAGEYVTPAGDKVSIGEAIVAARRGTVGHDGDRDSFVRPTATHATKISVTGESTVEALVRLDRQQGGHLGCLNVASAKNPGGGFLGGAQAQEESLARASALYPCLLEQPEHYARNRAFGSPLYLDLAIFSPHVPFFRDDDGSWLARPVLASVITCPAPNASALRQQQRLEPVALETTLRRRAELTLAIAAHHRVERLVLGAWGAGVFGNDPALVADAFRVPLTGSYAGVFAEVVFAVLGGPERPNHAAFVAAFG
ncbi:MAG: RNA 2'-phosphotransferase [Kofleriaceae bacterium]